MPLTLDCLLPTFRAMTEPYEGQHCQTSRIEGISGDMEGQPRCVACPGRSGGTSSCRKRAHVVRLQIAEYRSNRCSRSHPPYPNLPIVMLPLLADFGCSALPAT